MRDKDLYATILGISSPWSVIDVSLNASNQVVEVRVALDPKVKLKCPVCAMASRRYDSRPRRWRHLDTCQYRTILVADVARVECKEHGVLQVFLPWAEPGSRFTALFEALVIDWLREASITAVSRQLCLSWDEAAGIQGRAVQRGLRRRRPQAVAHIGIDETSFAKRHEYVTIVTEKGKAQVVHVADGRGLECLSLFYKGLTPRQLSSIQTVSMDMWPPYIQATRDHVPDADGKIAFDKFHVAQHLGQAVDKVRRSEHRELTKKGDRRLMGTKWLWLMSTPSRSEARAVQFDSLRKSSLKVAKAWQVKEVAMELWWPRRREQVLADFQGWVRWAKRVRLEPVQRVARTIAAHIDGIANAVVSGVTNAMSEGINSKVQWIKKMARGYRNRERFRNAIYFHLGGLDLYPACLSLTHTKP